MYEHEAQVYYACPRGWLSDPKLKDILRNLGLADDFRSSGKWPDCCKPVGANDFECH